MKQVRIATASNVPHSSVSRLLKRQRETGSVKDRKRPFMMLMEQLCYMRQLHNKHHIRATRLLVNSCLLKARLHAIRPAKRPNLTSPQR